MIVRHFRSDCEWRSVGKLDVFAFSLSLFFFFNIFISNQKKTLSVKNIAWPPIQIGRSGKRNVGLKLFYTITCFSDFFFLELGDCVKGREKTISNRLSSSLGFFLCHSRSCIKCPVLTKFDVHFEREFCTIHGRFIEFFFTIFFVLLCIFSLPFSTFLIFSFSFSYASYLTFIFTVDIDTEGKCHRYCVLISHCNRSHQVQGGERERKRGKKGTTFKNKQEIKNRK